MIAIDTNVLLRYLLMDDEIQSAKAARLIEKSNKVLITDVVLVETLWTLQGKKYKASKDDLINVINALFKESNIIFENGQTIWRSLHDFRLAKLVKVGSKKKAADFPDVLIINKSKFIAAQLDEKLDGVYTFDVAAREIEGTKEP